MAVEIYDATDEIISLIQDNWTEGQTPNIDKVWERRSVGLIDDRRDQIIITPKTENIQYFGLYGRDHLHDITIDLDIRTYQNDERHNLIVKEVHKIIKDNIRGNTKYTDLRIIASYTRNQFMRNMFNHVVTLSYRVTTPT